MIKSFITRVYENEYLIVAIYLLLNAIFFSTLLNFGNFADDAYNSQVRGSLLFQDISLYERTINEIKGWFFGAGRVFFLNWVWIYSLFYFINDTFYIKAIGLSLLISNFFIFYLIIKNITKSKEFSLMILLAFPLIIQFRNYHDPVLTYAFMIPLQFLLIQISLYLFLKYQFYKSYVINFIIVFLYSLALSIYELGYLFCFLFFYLNYFKNNNFYLSLKLSLPFILISFTYILITLFMKYIFIDGSGTYPGSNFHLNNILIFFKAFIIQLAASFPGINFFNSNKNLIFTLMDLLKLFSLFAIIYQFNLFIHKKININNSKLAISAIFLVFIPAFIVSLSGHQEELVVNGFGFSYLSVFFQYFGIVIALLILINFLKRFLDNNFLFYFFTIIFIFLFITNIGLNNKVLRDNNELYKYPRDILFESYKYGLFNELENNDYLFRFMLYPSDYHWSYATITGLKLKTCELSKIDQKSIDGGNNYLDCINELLIKVNNKNFFKNQKVWVLAINTDGKYGVDGRSILAKINSIELDDNQDILSINVNQIRYFDLASKKIEVINLDSEFNFKNITDERYLKIKDTKKLFFIKH